MSPDPWARLRRATNARIGLGRSGDTMPLRHVLEFQLAHARARDAVHAALDLDALAAALAPAGLPVLRARSAAADRATYLRRPDLGRRLAPGERDALPAAGQELAFVIADGLSAAAVQRHAAPVLLACLERLPGIGVAPVVLATQGRVALGDEIGERLGARLVVVLIGERPGLSVAESLGAYVTFAPRAGRRDSERNCVSNIHDGGGLPHAVAAERIAWLAREALRRGLTGVGLKDDRALVGDTDQAARIEGR
ncbi:ethanolamine ammonia-lyase subunit EutC [Roseomonas sp. NAR14]|uniref:Ethanolamine ammonia-lyase small subunit n=1 Tax=Roseomonas acroporae TaxID=2937791 RepID=A0A9X2BUN8_9PROT|nr:ethanolamine ammonia-lyase subunit EutC [Roseomonas acroporae]MCK8783194.1 ethanolamine ammonia-lyase subunit EutC [Roseomonas acroporae]